MVIIVGKEWPKVQAKRRTYLHALLARYAREGKTPPWEREKPISIIEFVEEAEIAEPETEREVIEFSPQHLASLESVNSSEFKEFVTADKRHMPEHNRHTSISGAVLWLDKIRTNGISAQQVRSVSYFSGSFHALEEHIGLIED